MNSHIHLALKATLEEITASGVIDVETQRNAIKEELQFYVLNFIYHHPEYGSWMMYGGSALRICYDLNRMSVDLDFEVPQPVTAESLESLKAELESHFEDTYATGPEFLTIKPVTGRGLLLKFHLGDELGLQHPSKQIHLKIDLNHFVAGASSAERRPINHGQLSFVIRTYNMSTLMASKIAAIFLRGQRGVGTAIYEGKGRDVYDLLWYMSKKVTPDLQYLEKKGVDAPDPGKLFDRLAVKLNEFADDNLRQDLTPLFADPTYIGHWLQNWRESYFRLVEAYRIHSVLGVKSVHVQQEFGTDIYYFGFIYDTAEGDTVRFVFALSEYWIEFGAADLQISTDPKVESVMSFSRDFATTRRTNEELLKQYATLFLHKIEDYLGKSNRVILGDGMRMKLIRMTADKLDQKEQILLNKSALLNCELEDLLR